MPASPNNQNSNKKEARIRYPTTFIPRDASICQSIDSAYYNNE